MLESRRAGLHVSLFVISASSSFCLPRLSFFVGSNRMFQLLLKLLIEENQTVWVRTCGVDASEKGLDFGTGERQKLSELIFSIGVELAQKDMDCYGRVASIDFVEGRNVNEKILRTGYAWHYTEYSKNGV